MPRISKAKPAVRASKPKERTAKRLGKPKDKATKRPRRGSCCYAFSPEAPGWCLCSLSDSKTYEDAMYSQGFPEVFGQPDVVWFTPPMAKEWENPQSANMAAGLWGGCINRLIQELLEKIKQGLVLKDGLVVTLQGAEIKLSAIEWRGRSMLELRPTDPRLRAPWEYDQSPDGNVGRFPASQ